MADNFTPEQKKILDIANKYFLRETNGDQEKADELMAKLATTVQDPGAKIIPIDDILFLVLVRGKGAVEVHTMASDLIPSNMVEGFKKLAKFLKDIGVKIAYTYTDDRRFARIARQTKLPIKEVVQEIDGKPMYVYIVEF
jgi:hypothetical protein